MEQPNIPEFMKKYHEAGDYDTRHEIELLAKSYDEERAMFLQTTFVEKQAFQNEWNKLTRDNKQISPDEALEPLNGQFEQQTKEIAIKNGYQEDRYEENLSQTDKFQQNLEMARMQNSQHQRPRIR